MRSSTAQQRLKQLVSSTLRDHSSVLARFFRGLDDPTRVIILQLLLTGEKTVSELVSLTGGQQGRVSTHLGCLRYCGYVKTRREGRNVYYRLADERVRALLRIAQELVADHAQELLSCAVVSPEMPSAALHGLEDADQPAPEPHGDAGIIARG